MALSGGGARGLAHVGVLRALESHGVKVDCLAGTSMGGILAAATAAGRTAADLEAASLELSHFGRLLGLADIRIPRGGLLTGAGVRSFLADLLRPHRSFESLPLPLTLVAVDLRSAREVYLKSGDLLKAVSATMAVPGLFEPVEWDGMQLVDGGVLNNLPADQARAMGAQIVVAVDVMLHPDDEAAWHTIGVPRIGLHLWRTLSIMIASQTEAKLKLARPEIRLQPPIPKGITTISGFRRVQEVIDAGEQAMEQAWPQLQALLEARP